MKVTSLKRRRKGAKRLDLSNLKKAMEDRRVWCALGVVRAAEGESKHYEIVEDGGKVDIMVDVETMPEGLDLTCRLGTAFGGPGEGLWAVPPEGAEVAVLVPSGQIDFMPVIVAVLSSGEVPERAQEGRTIIVATGDVEVTAPKVVLGDSPGSIVAVGPTSDGVLTGKAVDPFTGSTHGALGNASTKVFANK